MKKVYTSILALLLIVLIGLLFIFMKKDEESNLTKIKVAEVTHSVFYAPQYVAISEGYFEEEGLEIDLILTPGGNKHCVDKYHFL